MSRPCTVCSLPDQHRRKLERTLMTQNNTQASLASGYSRFALGRHKKHMSAAHSGQLHGPQHNHLHLHAEVPSREEAIEAARECLEVFAPHLLAAGPWCRSTSVVHPKVNRPAKNDGT